MIIKNEKFKAVVAVHLVLIKNQEVLLYLRQNTGFGDGLYSVVAGHVDGDEPVTHAMLREAKEEVDLDIRSCDLKVKCVMHRKTFDREVIDFFILCTQWHNEIKNLEPHKCKELKFFNFNNLPTNMVSYVKKGIECCLNDIFFLEFGWD